MDPTLFKEFCDEFTREMNRLRMEGYATIEAARSEVRRIERELDKLLELILKGGAADAINAKMVQLEHRKAALERQLADAEIPPPLLHPEMATFYREQVSTLHTALQDDSEATRLQAGEVLRTLVKEILLTPEAGDLKIDVRGNLAESWPFPSKRKPRPQGPGFRKSRWLRGGATTDTDIHWSLPSEVNSSFVHLLDIMIS